MLETIQTNILLGHFLPHPHKYNYYDHVYPSMLLNENRHSCENIITCFTRVLECFIYYCYYEMLLIFTATLITRLQKLLNFYLGTHNFHNFTAQK